jgi:hypothetical protein
VIKYVELISEQNVPKFDEPFGPGGPVVFDKKLLVKGYSEIRVWVHVFIRNYQAQPIAADSRLKVRFMHDFANGNSFDYDSGTVQSWAGASYIDGYVVKPIIGNELRVICEPVNLPPGPYDVHMTYYLVP